MLTLLYSECFFKKALYVLAHTANISQTQNSYCSKLGHAQKVKDTTYKKADTSLYANSHSPA